jgi:hypothetical protein
MRGTARDKDGEIKAIEQKLKDILPALPKEKNKDGTANREYILALLNRLNLIALSGLETGNLPMGYDALQRGLLRQAELNGFDPKHIADSRTAEEKALDVLERLSEEPSEIFGAMDEELDALEKSIQRAVELCVKYEQDKKDQEANKALSPPDPKMEAKTTLGKEMLIRLQRLRRIREQAKMETPSAKTLGYNPGTQVNAVRASHVLRFMTYVMRSDNIDRRSRGPGGAVLEWGYHHAEMAWAIWLARSGSKVFPLYVETDRKKYPYEGAILVSPPGHGKTTIAEGFVGLALNIDPSEQVIWLHTAKEEASKNVKHITTFFDEAHPPGRRNYALFQRRLAKHGNNATTMTLETREQTKQPNLKAHGIADARSGSNASMLIMDDIVDQKQIHLQTYRDTIYNLVSGTWMRRLRGTRTFHLTTATLWHADDPVSRRIRLVHNKKSFVLVRIQRTGGPGEVPPFKAVWPEEFPSIRLKKIYQEMNNPALFAAQYQAFPKTDATRIVRELRLYNPLTEEHARFMRGAMFHLSVDPAATNREKSDKAGLIYAACGEVKGIRKDEGQEFEDCECRLRIVDVRQFNATQSELAEAVAHFCLSRPVDYVHVETQSGYAATAEMLTNQYGMDVVTHVPGNKSKELRFRGVASVIEHYHYRKGGGGAVVEFPGVVKDGSLVPDPDLRWVFDQVLNFGSHAEDHCVDALTQLCKHLVSSGAIQPGKGIISEQVMGVAEGRVEPRIAEFVRSMRNGPDNQRPVEIEDAAFFRD